VIRASLLAIVVPIAGCGALLGIDDLSGPADGDASVDAPDGPPPAPALRSPRLGVTTGSVHAGAACRPRCVGRTVGGATRYGSVVDDWCQPASFTTCLFPSPEVMESVTAETFSPAASLAVNLSAPVGRRYFWRVRACNDFGCGDWSAVWYLDVGRLADDVNGDGYGDLVVGINANDTIATQVGAAYIVFGHAGGGAATTAKLTDPRSQVNGRFGSAVAMVGDMNADGYGDVVVGAWKHDNSTHTGTAFLYLGRGTWPASVAMASTAIGRGAADVDTQFGGALAGRGDMNGDGYADVAIGSVPPLFGGATSPPTTPGYVHVNFGRAIWSFSQLGSDLVIPDPAGEILGVFGAGLSFGDLDEDGRSDLFVGGLGASPFSGGGGVYFGQSSYPAAPFTINSASVALPSPAQGAAAFGLSAAFCSPTSARPVLAVGAPLESRPAANAGATRVYAGREPWPAAVTAPELTLADPSGALNASMGVSVRCGDVTADHRDDMVVGAPTGDDTGTVYVFGDIAGLPNAHMVALTSGDPSAGILGQTVAVTDFDGDGIADVFAGAPNLPAGHAGRVLGWLGRSVWPSSIATADITIDNPSGVADERFGRALD